MKRRRGRPTGYTMNEESREKVRKSRLGQKMKQETKDKISAGVLRAHETGAPIEVIRNTDLDKCGTYKNNHGYMMICIPNPILGTSSYRQRLHVAIMEKKLDRKLRRGEEIHHWGEKDDNRLHMITLCHTRRAHTILDKAKKIMVNEPAEVCDRLLKALQLTIDNCERIMNE